MSVAENGLRKVTLRERIASKLVGRETWIAQKDGCGKVMVQMTRKDIEIVHYTSLAGHVYCSHDREAIHELLAVRPHEDEVIVGYIKDSAFWHRHRNDECA